MMDDRNGRALERQVADHYRRMGAWKAQHNMQLAGQQIDVYAEMVAVDRSRHRIVVEVKDWQRAVGIDVVQHWVSLVYNLRHAGLVDEGIIVSSGGFTKSAHQAVAEYVRQGVPVRLVELADLQVYAGSDGVKMPVVEVQIAGFIEAGKPVPVPDSDPLMGDETIKLLRCHVGDPEGVYALRVKGNSMVDALVHDGDIVIVRHQQRVENGEMAVAWLKDREETTLKRFYQEEDGRVQLRAENSKMETIYVDDPCQIEVHGKVIRVVRYYNDQLQQSPVCSSVIGANKDAQKVGVSGR